MHDDGFDLCTWESGGLIGNLSKPFPYVTAWNLPESFWNVEPDPAPDTPLEEEDRLWEAWDKVLTEHYLNPAIMNGAIPICHQGCALRKWLVIKGDQRGFVCKRKDRLKPRHQSSRSKPRKSQDSRDPGPLRISSFA